jgi:hypothetical protein
LVFPNHTQDQTKNHNETHTVDTPNQRFLFRPGQTWSQTFDDIIKNKIAEERYQLEHVVGYVFEWHPMRLHAKAAEQHHIDKHSFQAWICGSSQNQYNDDGSSTEKHHFPVQCNF